MFRFQRLATAHSIAILAFIVILGALSALGRCILHCLGFRRRGVLGGIGNRTGVGDTAVIGKRVWVRGGEAVPFHRGLTVFRGLSLLLIDLIGDSIEDIWASSFQV